MSYSSCRVHFFLCSSQTPLLIHSQQWFQNIDNLSGLCVPDMPFSLIETLQLQRNIFLLLLLLAWKSRGGESEQIARNNHLYASAFLSQEASSFFSGFSIFLLSSFSTMVITDGKVHRRSTITTTTTPPPLNPVERAYATELASLQKRAKSNPHQDYYYHDTSTTGTTPKWTLKRKRSLTKSNLHHHNKRNNNNNNKRSSSSKPEESPTAVDLISPTGQTHWSTISLTDLLAAPRRSDIPDFPGKTDRHVYRDKAYKRARAGLLKSQYSPWDYVSNGALPNTACKIQPNKILTQKEKIWWKIQNTAYDRRDADGIMIREGYLTEWYFNSELRGGVWYRQPKMLEPGPRGYVPKAWLYRWVVVARRNKGGEWWDGGIGPRGERVEIYCYDHHALVGVDVESGNNMEAATAATAVVEKGSSSSSSMKNITPVLDSTGLSFCRWEKVQERQKQHQLRIPSPQPNPTLPHLPNPSNNKNNNNKKPPTTRKRKRKSKLVPDSINPHPNTDDKEQPHSKRHQSHQEKHSTPTPTPATVKATTPKFHYTKEFSAEIDEAGLSIVRWRRRHHDS